MITPDFFTQHPDPSTMTAVRDARVFTRLANQVSRLSGDPDLKHAQRLMPYLQAMLTNRQPMAHPYKKTTMTTFADYLASRVLDNVAMFFIKPVAATSVQDQDQAIALTLIRAGDAAWTIHQRQGFALRASYVGQWDVVAHILDDPGSRAHLLDLAPILGNLVWPLFEGYAQRLDDAAHATFLHQVLASPARPIDLPQAMARGAAADRAALIAANPVTATRPRSRP